MIVEGEISKFDIEKVIKISNNQHLKNKFAGVYPSNHLNRFVDFHKPSPFQKVIYPYLISNTDRSDKTGTHCGTLLI